MDVIQAGITGPPSSPGNRVRVWSDVLTGSVTVRHANSGVPIASATITPQPLPPPLAGDARIGRRVFEIGNLPSDTLVEIAIGGEVCRVLTLPPAGGELRLLLGSCFHITEDHGRVWDAYQRLRSQDLPHLRVHCGDQLYMDAGSLPGGPTAFERSRRRYDDYWGDATYKQFLRAGASLFVGDDHEFWNDYPYRMPHLSRSWDGAWVAHRDAALTLFFSYQALGNPNGDPWFTLDLGFVSMFVLDTRTRRGTNKRNAPKRLFDDPQRQALQAWSQTLTKPGLLVSAMPLLQKPSGKFLFITTDHNLLAFPDDARVIWSAVEQASHDVLVVAGDIHKGRKADWMSGSGFAARRHHEITSSPLSLLSWGPGNRAEGEAAPSGLDLGPMGRRDSQTTYATALDHFTLFRFNNAPTGVRVDVQLLEIPTATTPMSALPPFQKCETQFFLK